MAVFRSRTLFLLLCLHAHAAFCLDPGRPLYEFRLDHWGVDKGLPHSSISALLQTRDGFLWIGTLRGLTRFDGTTFKTVEPLTALVPRARNITVLAEGPDGSIWIGTEGAGLFRYRQDAIQVFDRTRGFPENPIKALTVDGLGRVWAGTSSSGVLRIAPPYGPSEVRIFAHRDGLPDGTVNDLTIGPDGSIWVATAAGGVHVINEEGVRPVSLPKELSGATCYTLRTWHSRTMILSTSAGMFSLENGTASRLLAPPGSPTDGYTTVCTDRDGNIWAGSYMSGLYRFSAGSHRTSVSRLTRPEGLAGNFVSCLLEDREGNIWIGTEDGLDRLCEGPVTTVSDREGLTHESVMTLAEDRAGDVWVGTDGGGIFRIRERRVIEQIGPSSGLEDGYVSALTVDSEDGLLIGTDYSGLFTYRDGKILPVVPRVRRRTIAAIVPGRDGSLWIGTAEGLEHRRAHGGASPDTVDVLPRGAVNAVLEDRSGDLWVGMREGIARVRDRQVTMYGQRDGLPAEYVTTIYEDSTGTLWAGTSGGIARFRSNRWEAFGADKGLPDELVTCILEDGLGYLWMGSTRGIIRIARSRFDSVASGGVMSLHALTFGVSDGMKTAECSEGGQTSGLRRHNGELWFSTARGVAIVDPLHLKLRRTMPAVVFEEIVSDPGKRYRAGPVALTAGENNFTIAYTVPTFTAPERVRFRYRLEGFDPAWIDAGARRVAYYTNIPPGGFVFHVEAYSTESESAVSTASLGFTIAPHFYQRDRFLIILAAAIGLFTTGALVIRDRREKARKKTLARMVEDRTRALREEILERRRAETALRESEERQNAILRLMPVVLYGAKIPDEIDATWMSENVERVTGFPPGRFTGEPRFWMSRIHPEDLPGVNQQVESLREGVMTDAEYRWLCADGSYRWFLDHVVSNRPAEEGQYEYFGVWFDITERRKAEDRLKKSLGEKEALLKEVHHRVKNNLAIITSLLHMQSSTLKEESLVEVLLDAENRVRSMAAIHEQLYQSDDLGAIDFRAYVDRLVGRLLRTYSLPGVSYVLDINNIYLEIANAIPCGLIVNELVTNAVKYAFSDRHHGTIRIGVAEAPGNMLQLTVRDDGAGIPAGITIKHSSTMGLQLVALLAQQLGGTAEIQADAGTVCTVTFPHSRIQQARS
jgi:PAS domain S-box-containing protein